MFFCLQKKKLVSLKGMFFSNKWIFLFFLHLCFRNGFCSLVCKSCFSAKIVFCMFVFATFYCKGLSFFFAKGFDLFFARRVFFFKKKKFASFFFLKSFFFCGGRGRLFFSEGFVLFFFEVFVFSKRDFVFFQRSLFSSKAFFPREFVFFSKEFVFPMR